MITFKVMNTYLKKGLIALLIPVMYYTFAAWYIKSGNTTESNETGITSVSDVSNISAPAPQQKDFKMIIYNKSYVDYWVPEQTMEYNISNGFYDELGFNMLHNFGDSPGSIRFGQFGVLKTQQQLDNFSWYMDAVDSGGFSGLYSTVHIMNLCFAQRMIYEVNPVNGTHDVNNGFCYQYCSGEYMTDQGRTVLYVSEINDATPRYIAKDIYENLQFGDLTNWAQADAEDWHVKPMMRINANVPDGKRIAKIEVINFKGDPIKNIIINSENFKNGQGYYGGEYKDIFLNINNIVTGGRATDPDVLNTEQDYNDWRNWEAKSKVSFNVWWYGEADVWFDKMTVDDKYGDQLFNHDYDPHIKQEASAFTDNPSNYSFYTDEMNYSNIPCIEYVKGVMTGSGGNPNAQLHVALSNYHQIRGLKDNTIGHREMLKLFQNIGIKSVSLDAHEISDLKMPPQFNAGNMSDFISYWFTANYDEYNISLQHKAFGDKYAIIPENENDLYDKPRHWGSLIYQVNHARQQRDTYYPGIPMFVQPEMHSVLFWNNSLNKFDYGMREPTNQEIEAQAMLSIAHGADGIGWYIYQSFTEPSTLSKYSLPYQNASVPGTFYTFGLLNLANQNFSKRTSNLFGQDKWSDVASMQSKFGNWKPTLDNTRWLAGYSVHSETANHYYINDLASIAPNISSTSNCFQDWPVYADCEDERYWEMGFFEPVNPPLGDQSRYFMLVNRRCVPVQGSSGTDQRYIRLRFNKNMLPATNSYVLTDIASGESETFDINGINGYVEFGTTQGSLGWFEPGEGKMFKLTPVFQEGGELVADDTLSGNMFFGDTIITNGHNVVIEGTNTTLTFSDSACIIMNGGTFTVDDASEMTGPNDKNIFKSAVSGHKWGGLKFNGTNVKIYNSKFEDISSNQVNYAIKTLNCPLVDIRYNIFNSSSDTSGGVQAVYTESESPFSGLYVTYNTVNMNNSRGNGICVQGFSGLTVPLYVMNNTLTSNGYATGVMLSTVTGGVVKNNSITGFSIGINTLFSTADLYGNTITNTSAESKGIFTSGESSLGMMPSGTTWLGGYNVITNISGSSINLQTDNSVFFTDGGRNKFDVTTSASPSAYHMYGSFWDGSYSYRQRNNCFKLDGTAITSPTLPYNYVVVGMDQVSLSFLSYDCSTTLPTEEDIVDIGNGLYDTIPSSGGQGGGLSSVTSETPKQLYDAIRTAMRHRNYTNSKSKCYELISTYPDSTESIASLQTLFMSVIASDTGEVSSLKSFYEELILNHSSNTALVKISHYLVQKCKVQLGQYTSALSGFEQIINANPTSYEGLLARWDYMATSLLVQGQGGAYRGENEEGDDDKSPFTKEQRKVINNSVKEVYNISRTNDGEKIKNLEEKANNGDIGSKKELQKRSALRDLIKTQRPKDVIEHMKIVSSDIQKVFGSTVPISDKKENENIPLVFRLSQNYPNPFNPVTKINYDIPRDAKVNIVVYDILGREVVRLVNNEIKTAGFYIAQFNAMNYASGVYFYRIEAEEPNGKKFVDSKKMVLLK